MGYDNASWHYGGNFPKDLPSEAGATHIGMFFVWMAAHGMASEMHLEDESRELKALLAREITPGAFVLESLDEKLSEEDFSDVGNDFAKVYYGAEGFYADLEKVSAELPSVYHLPDTWESFDSLAPLIDKAFGKWSAR